MKKSLNKQTARRNILSAASGLYPSPLHAGSDRRAAQASYGPARRLRNGGSLPNGGETENWLSSLGAAAFPSGCTASKPPETLTARSDPEAPHGTETPARAGARANRLARPRFLSSRPARFDRLFTASPAARQPAPSVSRPRAAGSSDSSGCGRSSSPRQARPVWGLIAAALLFGLLFRAFPCAASEKTLVALGDSIAFGYGLAAPERDGYPALLADFLGMSVKMEAVNGYRAENVLRKMETAETAAALAEASAVCLSVGGNELLYPFSQALSAALPAGTAPSEANVLSAAAALLRVLSDEARYAALKEAVDANLAAFGEQYPEIVARIRRQNPDALIFTQTLYNPFDGTVLSAFVERFAYAFDEINRVILSVGGCVAAPVAEAFSGRSAELTNIGSLDIHPNRAGHRLIFSLLRTEYLARELIGAPRPLLALLPAEPRRGF